jgi:hypothetical protein
MRRKSAYMLQLCLLVSGILAFNPASAQDDPPPPPQEHGLNGDQPKDAPIGEGVIILAGLGLMYGASRAAKHSRLTK